MNWQHFQTYNDAPTHAFEAMCNQLFELWCKRNYSNNIESFSVVNGSGGDGGVEAYAVLKNNSIVGVQSKWFLNSITEGQFNQIIESVKTALQVRPTIKKYIISIPRDLSSEKVGKRKKIVKDTEANRWESLKADLLTTFPGLDIELWTDTRLLTELQYSEASGVYRYWFEKSEISAQVVISSFEKQQSGWLSQKYTPSLHSKGIIYSEIEKFIGNIDNRKSILQKLIKIETLYRNFIRQADDYLSVISRDASKDEIIVSIKNIEFQVNEVLNIVSLIKKSLATDSYISLSNNNIDWWIDFGSILSHLESERHIDKNYFHIADLKKAIDTLENISIRNVVSSLTKQLNSTKLLILGNPGTGKTHGIADVVKNLIMQKKHTAILIQAKSISKDASWKDIILKALGLSSTWNEDEIWQGLEALSYRNEVKEAIKQTNGECYITPKLLICIDGIDESRPYEMWIERLRETEVICKKYPRLKFCFTSRPYAFNSLTPSDSLLRNKLFLPSDGDVPVKNLFEPYIEHFNIKANGCTWIKWSIKTPLVLKLFCELYAGQSIGGLSRSAITITKLLEKKIENIDNEFRVACNNDFKANDFIVRKAIACLAKCFFEKNEITRNELFEILSHAQDLTMLTLTHKSMLIEHIENYGLLQSYAVESQDILSHPTIYYILGIQPIFDYLFAVMLVKQREDPRQLIFTKNVKNNQGALQMASIILLEDRQILVSDIPCFQNELSNGDLFDLICFALSNVSPSATKKYIPLVKHIMGKDTNYLKEIVNRIVLPVARIGGHPLGPKLLHEYLLSFDCAAKRDIIWSTPNRLNNSRDAIWNSHIQLELQNDIYTLCKEDKEDGLPLVYVWSLTTVDNIQRAYYRKELMKWGQICPSEFYIVLENVYSTTDPQMKEDLLAIAMGVAFSVNVDNIVINLLGKWVLKTIFATEKIITIYDAAIRYYGRAIAERAFACGFISIDELEDCRPPYKIGSSLIAMNEEATKGTRMGGFGPIDYDLSRYVICDPIKRRFFYRVHENSTNALEDNDIDYTECFTVEEIVDIMKDQDADLSKPCKKILLNTLFKLREQAAYRSHSDMIYGIYDEDEIEENIQDVLEVPSQINENEKQYIYNKEADEFLKSHAIKLGRDSIELDQFALAVCYAYIIVQGWNEEDGHPNGGKLGEILGADVAIGRQYHSATHGSKSHVMNFCEKYVWCARNELYGYLADRLPCRDEDGSSLIDDYGLLDDFVNPAQELNQKNPDELRRSHEWLIPELLSPQIDSLGNTYDDITHWINDAPIPDFKKWIEIDSSDYQQLQIENKQWLSLYSFNAICEQNVGVESIMWISSAILNTQDFHCLLNDLSRNREYIKEELENPEDLYSLTESDIYITPKEICWMNWKKDYYNTITNATVDNGNLKVYKITKAVEECTGNYDEYGDVHYKLPSHTLRSMLNIIDGDGHQYFDNTKDLKAIYFESGERWDDTQSFLCVDQNSLYNALEAQRKHIFWIVRLIREPSKKAREKYENLRLRKDRNWIVWFENGEVKSQMFINTTDF